MSDANMLHEVDRVVVFKKKDIRRKLYRGEWYFSVIDVVGALSDSPNPRRYWSDLKRQLIDKEGFFQLYGKIVQFKLQAPDGKMRETDCADTETIFRIVQSIPSPKAEPFKRWLAKVGYERMQETIDSVKWLKKKRWRRRILKIRLKLAPCATVQLC